MAEQTSVNSTPADCFPYPRKQQYRESPCPPPAPKALKRMSLRSLAFLEHEYAKIVHFANTVTLSRLYNPAKAQSYFEQIYIRYEAVGEGSFGIVYKVQSREDGRIYAVKQLKPRQSLQFGYAEVKNWEKVGHHPNCVQYFMAWEEDRTIHLKMEYCHLSLAQYAMKTPKIMEAQLWEILYDMLNALDYLHSKNLVHLDVKPGNIMMHLGYYKLGDFGLLVDLNKYDGRKISTISDGDSRYLASEVLMGIYTPSCDIFGLGMTLLELATCMELPSFGYLWHEMRQKVPDLIYKIMSDSFALTVEQMLVNEYIERPSAAKLLRKGSLMKVKKRDNMTSRTIHEAHCDGILFNDQEVLTNNNNIIDTPRRPLAVISNGSANSQLSHVECTELNRVGPRRALFRVKLDF